MKKIAILLALFCLGLVTASLAVAQAPPGKGKPEGKGKKTTTSSTDPAACKPKISVILKGTFVSGGGTSFTMNVTQTNFHGRDLVGSPLTLTVDDKTMFRRNGHAELSDFKADDLLNVQARACKKQKNATQAPAAAPTAMLAKRVTGHPAKASDSTDAGTTTTTP
ncbi:MAG TPA: hypothetical protein VIL91_02565 [Gaiellaceae bacterium]|jgi:hypothetical protein